MKRRTVLGALAGGLVAAPWVARAQPTNRFYRIGYLTSGSPSTASPVIDAFREGLRELGWVEGRNIGIHFRFADGKFERLPDLAAELVRLKVDLIIAVPTPAAIAAKNATATIPIVMINAGDPVGVGLIASLAHPGGNLTGLAWSAGLEILGKQLGLLKEAVPSVRRAAVLSNPANPVHSLLIQDVKVAAGTMGLPLLLLDARGPGEFDAAFATMAKERVGGVLVVSDSMFALHRELLADLEARYRLPSMHGTRANVEAGGLLYYGPNFPDQWRRAASFVDKILKGTKPGDLPVQQPARYELMINLRTAKTLGLVIPPALLLRADEVIK